MKFFQSFVLRLMLGVDVQQAASFSKYFVMNIPE